MKKVKVKKNPPVGVSPQSLNPGAFPLYSPSAEWNKPDTEVNSTLGPVDREDSNLEAEKGETAFIPNLNDLPAHFDIGGKKHSQGGTPLNLPDDSFIFSDTPSMEIKGPVLKNFGKSEKTKKKYTPADLAKQYDINNYRKILADPDSDKMEIETAELMIENYNKKLGMLGLVQEAKKGFPKGIPQIAMPYLMMSGTEPDQVLPQSPSLKKGGQFYQKAGQVNSLDDLIKEGEVKKQRQLEQLKERLSHTQMGIPVAAQSTLSTSNPYIAANNFAASMPSVARPVITSVPPAESVATSEGKKRVLVKTPAIVPSTNSIYNKNWASEAGKKYGFKLPSAVDVNTERVPGMQTGQGRKSGQYGKKDWWDDPNLQTDWKTRHQWFLKDHPDFDPRKPGATKEFQDAYNKRMDDMGVPRYFDQKWGKPFSADDKFGEHTWAAPDPSIVEQKAPEVKKAEAVKDRTLTPGALKINQASNYAPWWLQDVVRTAGAAGDFLRIKKYLPWAPKIQPYVPETTFYDPTRELAANSEQMNIGTQGAETFSGPQQFNSRFSQIQGQGAKNAADILGRYNNLNVGESDRASAMRADIMNKANEFNAKTAQDLYDKTTIANQQFDNSKNMGRQALRQSFIDSLTNRAQAQTLNSMYPNYQVDSSTGGLMYFAHGDKMLPSSQGDRDAIVGNMKYFQSQFPEGNPSDWYRMATGIDPEGESIYDRPRTSGYYNRGRTSPDQFRGYPGYGK